MTATLVPGRSGGRAGPGPAGPNPLVRPGPTPYLFSAALVVLTALSAGLTVAFPAVLHGAAVSDGNLRGTAVALLIAGLPVLVAASLGTLRGSARALVVWLGALGYVIYQGVLLCFATPMNNLFLFYVATLGTAVWSTVLLLRAVSVTAFASRLGPAVPARTIAGAALTLAGSNALAWLAQIVPAVSGPTPTTVLAGTGLITNPVYVQDLAIWIPLLVVAGVACWRRAPWGLLITPAVLALFALESVSISVDQWFGSRADPHSSVSSAAMTPVFALVAVVTAAVVARFLRSVDRRPHPIPVPRTTLGAAHDHR